MERKISDDMDFYCDTNALKTDTPLAIKDFNNKITNTEETGFVILLVLVVWSHDQIRFDGTWTFHLPRKNDGFVLPKAY